MNGNTGSEYTIWISKDPHARAYEALFDERSLRMQENLHRSAKAHQDQRCLKCHVAPELDRELDKNVPYFRTDGVSCESCHGPAGNWLNIHHLPAWKGMSLGAKQAHGMNDTRTVLGRARLCVTCHVGVAGMDVDHDLIAAGHPRLNFEFSAFQAHMPRHWPDAKDRDPGKHPRGRADFEARAWATGQLVTAQAALELLADRASDPDKPWPEFAEYDCAACHHDLQSPSSRQQKGFGDRKPGAFPWGNFVTLTALTMDIQGLQDPVLLKHLDKLHAAMDAGNPQRKVIAESARAAAISLKPWLKELDQKPFNRKWIDSLQSVLAKNALKTGGSWDDISRLNLALAAMHRARKDMKLPVRADDFRSKSDLSTKHYDPEALRTRLLEFKNTGQKKR